MPFWNKYKVPTSPDEFFERLIACINREGVSIYISGALHQCATDAWQTDLIFNDERLYRFDIPGALLRRSGPTAEAMAMRALIDYRNYRRQADQVG